jgi:hypothetical protein
MLWYNSGHIIRQLQQCRTNALRSNSLKNHCEARTKADIKGSLLDRSGVKQKRPAEWACTGSKLSTHSLTGFAHRMKRSVVKFDMGLYRFLLDNYLNGSIEINWIWARFRPSNGSFAILLSSLDLEYKFQRQRKSRKRTIRELRPMIGIQSWIETKSQVFLFLIVSAWNHDLKPLSSHVLMKKIFFKFCRNKKMYISWSTTQIKKIWQTSKNVSKPSI